MDVMKVLNIILLKAQWIVLSFHSDWTLCWNCISDELMFLLKACRNFSLTINNAGLMIPILKKHLLFFFLWSSMCASPGHMLTCCPDVPDVSPWPHFYCARQHLAATQGGGNTHRSIFNVAVARRQLGYSVDNWRNIGRAVQLDLGETVLVRLHDTLDLWWKKNATQLRRIEAWTH